MRSRWVAAWVALVCLIPLLGWWLYGLFDLDEGFYAAVTAEMNRRGEWITPFYNGKPWFEKPILLYWLAKPCVLLFFDEFGARMPSVAASLITYWLVWRFGKRFLGELSGLAAAFVLATSLFFVAIGRMMLVDPILITCLTGAFLTFWESLVGDQRWRIASAGLLGLAVLAKGPVALVLFVIVAGYTVWREPELRPAFRNWWVVGFGVLLMVVALWYVPAYLANRELFVQEFLVKQNLQRFKGGDEAHAVPMPGGLIYYIPVVLLGMIPWSLFIPRAWPKRGLVSPDAPFKRYLATWAVVVFAFFTISGTKLPHYVLPCFPPLAMLVGHDLAGRWKELSAKRLAGLVIASMALAAFLTVGFSEYHRASQVNGEAILDGVRGNGSPGWTWSKPDEVVFFRLARQPEANYPPIPPVRLFDRIAVRINETSAPSAVFYTLAANRSGVRMVETDRADGIVTPHPVAQVIWVLTRPGRLTQADFAVFRDAGYSAVRYSPQLGPEFDGLLLVAPASAKVP